MYNRKLAAIIIILLMALLSLTVYVHFFKKTSLSHKEHMDMAMSMHEAKNLPPGYAMVHVDPARIQLLGVSTEKVLIRDLQKTIRTVGIVEVDETRQAVIQTKFSGWIEKLFVNFIGMPVKQDEPLFSVYSPDLLATQEEYLIALKDGSKDLIKATRQRLELWDVPSEQIVQLEQGKKTTKTLTIKSPLTGVVLDKKAFIGMNVEPGMPVFTLADLSHVWVLADVYENDIAAFKIGQRAKLAITSLPGESFDGIITFISYVVQASTRTAKVRFECDNTDQRLKPGMYATVQIILDMGKNLALPEEAIIDTGKRKIVFIDQGKGRYHPRTVEVGFKADPYYQAISGIEQGDAVVTSTQFLFDSESRIKAQEGGSMKAHGM
ncbi:efflux RND transporter periplasmic adaptor subunit [Candidatus Babeliales bacterium]|nr:efflux RND transporter periplasmic adaptor subunit [Candidatus Babeliales bacterium]